MGPTGFHHTVLVQADSDMHEWYLKIYESGFALDGASVTGSATSLLYHTYAVGVGY